MAVFRWKFVSLIFYLKHLSIILTNQKCQPINGIYIYSDYIKYSCRQIEHIEIKSNNKNFIK